MKKSVSSTRDMTEGSIPKLLMLFAIPLMFGNLFQMLYNTVDSIVVGNFVGTEALAAIGATTLICNMAVFFFNGFAVGAGVVIGHCFGAHNEKELHKAVETTMAITLILSVVFTILGILLVNPLLNMMRTPADVFDEAAVYLRIYFGGISGLLIYNMGSGILTAVGDSRRPLYFLILTSLLNIVLDLWFVCGFHMGIGGAAYATILSQFISAGLILRLLMHTKEIYRFSFKDLQINGKLLYQILRIGLPNGVQSAITAFSNIFVQSYVNYFGSTVMAGWAGYNKINQFVMLPITSMANAATTFVSQNEGAGNTSRSNTGTKWVVGLAVLITFVIATILFPLSPQVMRLFSSDPDVIKYGVLFNHLNIYFLLFNTVNHVLAGALRGRGDSTGPMVIMLLGFVAVRQVYLFVMTRYFVNTPASVAFGYPVGWMFVFAVETAYFFLKWNKKDMSLAAYQK